MEIIRKITYSGHSTVLIVPRTWIESVELQAGKKVERVKLHIDGNLVVEPYFGTEELGKK